MLEFEGDVAFDELLDIPDDAVKLVGSELVVLELSGEVEFFPWPLAPVLLDFVKLAEAVRLLGNRLEEFDAVELLGRPPRVLLILLEFPAEVKLLESG